MIQTRLMLNSLLALILSIFIPVGFIASAAERGEVPAKTRTPHKIDLNQATADQLQELPGIGPAYAQKIIEHRPYQSVRDLSKAGIPASTVDKISERVTVKRAAEAKTPRSSTRPAATSSRSEKTPVTKSAPAARSPKPAAPAVADDRAGTAATSGKVWLNTDSNIYHRPGSRWYGQTKSGKYVSEQEAIAAGARESEEH
jgi:hypothetical protein